MRAHVWLEWSGFCTKKWTRVPGINLWWQFMKIYDDYTSGTVHECKPMNVIDNENEASDPLNA